MEDASQYREAMCSEGRARLKVASEIDDRRPHGQVSRVTDKLLSHLRECVVCRDALGPYADLLLTIRELSGLGEE